LPGNPTREPEGCAVPQEGIIVSVQRLSTEDGPGIRSTVFFKRCPLSCRWCQNPETISPRPEVQWFAARCIGCRTCRDACPNGNITVDGSGVSIDRQRCQGCGECARECPATALELIGRKTDAAELARELAKDRTFYDQSGGGVTLSGGEPLAQPGFAAALARSLKEEGIFTALDTCGFAAPEALAQVLPHVSLVLYDLKMIDPAGHAALTGRSNTLILENLFRVADAAREGDLSLWVRTPLVPGVTATQENLEGLGRLISRTGNGVVQRWELCSFNNLCRDKYRRLDKPWDFALTPLMSREELEELAAYARHSGVEPGIVSVTGAARRDA
jgi:pyruvate formate lyase activating enzyme